MFSREFCFCFFTSYAYMCTNIRRHFKEATPKSIITWSEMGRQNIQAKKVYLVITLTHDMVLLTLPPPYLKQCWSPNNRKDDITIQHCFGRRGGGGEKVEFFSFETIICFALKLSLEVFLYNLFRSVAFSNDPCALQKHTIDVIERICGIPGTEGVTVTPHKVWVLEAPLMKSFSF